jgi:hypothetical protein
MPQTSIRGLLLVTTVVALALGLTGPVLDFVRDYEWDRASPLVWIVLVPWIVSLNHRFPVSRREEVLAVMADLVLLGLWSTTRTPAYGRFGTGRTGDVPFEIFLDWHRGSFTVWGVIHIVFGRGETASVVALAVIPFLVAFRRDGWLGARGGELVLATLCAAGLFAWSLQVAEVRLGLPRWGWVGDLLRYEPRPAISLTPLRWGASWGETTAGAVLLALNVWFLRRLLAGRSCPGTGEGQGAPTGAGDRV